MTEIPNEMAEYDAPAIIVPGDVTARCKMIPTWDEVVSWPGVQDAARSAIAGLRRLQIAVTIAQNEKLISVAGAQVTQAEQRIADLRAELDEIDGGTP